MDNPYTLPALDGFAVPAGERLDVSAGGFLIGPGTETSDEIAAVAPAGCFILNAEAVKAVGRETLDALLALSREIRWDGRFSPGEYVMPPFAVAVLGRHFLHSLNDSGQLLYSGHSSNPDEHRRAMHAAAEDAREMLKAIATKAVGWKELAAAALREDSRSTAADERGILQGGGHG